MLYSNLISTSMSAYPSYNSVNTIQHSGNANTVRLFWKAKCQVQMTLKEDTFINFLKSYYNFFLLRKSITAYTNKAGAQPILEPCITFKQ